MALIVEDGSGVPNANSYGDVAGARSYTADRGVTLDASDVVVASQLVLGTDYLESFASRYVGRPTSFTQSLSWPRQGVQFDPDNPFPDDEIPQQLINALYQSVIEQASGLVLQPSVDHSSGGFVTLEKVGPLETRFSEIIGTSSQPILTKVDALVLSLLGGPFIPLRVTRI